MKILVAIDKEEYSRKAAAKAVQLARNTWADVTLLGLQDERTSKPSIELVEEMMVYGHLFTAQPDSPYSIGPFDRIEELGPGRWMVRFLRSRGRKQLRFIVRAGNLLKQVMAQVEEEGPDMIILGMGDRNEAQWGGYPDFPVRVAEKAPCTVLIVKEDKAPRKMVCCLDQDEISQESLELINQFVTIHDAELTILAVMGGNGLKERVEAKLRELVRYYTDLGIKTWIWILEPKELVRAVEAASSNSIVGLWMGKRSFLHALFSKNQMEELVEAARSMVLILK